jgi:ABC-2 type transport system ATP-binding protein
VSVGLAEVRVRYGRKTALHVPGWEAPPGRTAVLGLNGSGKSTLLKCLAKLQKPSKGRVVIPPVGKIGYLAQDFSFPGNFTVREMLTYVGWLRGLSAREAASRAESVANIAGLMEQLPMKLSSLSGGMLQRAALLQTTVHDPDLLLLDEPTVGLDVVHHESILRFLSESISAERLIFTTHVLEDVTRLADHVLILDSGSIIFEGDTAQFMGMAGQFGKSADPQRALLQILASLPIPPETDS